MVRVPQTGEAVNEDKVPSVSMGLGVQRAKQGKKVTENTKGGG